MLAASIVAVLCAWTIAYGQYHKRKGERVAAAAQAAAQEAPPESLPAERPRPQHP